MSSGSVNLDQNFGSGEAGSVESVSANAPLSSTGGTNPLIEISQATVTTNGYLSSTDWNIFNNKFLLPSFTAGSVLFSDGTTIAENNASLFWDNTNCTLEVTQPSSVTATVSGVVITLDPAGDHGNGNHLEIAGNPGGGGTIFRTDGGLNKSWLQIYGGDATGTESGQVYVNGNNSTDGDAGGVQIVTGLQGAYFQVLDHTYAFNLFTVTDNGSTGIVNILSLSASSLVGTDPSSNLVSVAYNAIPYAPGDATKWVAPVPVTVQEALDRIAAVVGATIPIP